MEEEQMLTKEQILDMLDAGQYKELKEELGNMYPVDITARYGVPSPGKRRGC